MKNAIAMLDAVEILVSQGAIFSANLPARGLFETYLFLHWMLKEDAERRAKQYYVWHLRQELRWHKRGISGSKDQTDFFNSMGEFAKVFSEEIKSNQDDIKKQRLFCAENQDILN